MSSPTTKLRFQLLQVLALAACVALALFVWEGSKGLNLPDEGFLWYGAQRVMSGEVPLRDFMSYDPGRYWWTAALMRLWGDDGIMALRGAVSVFQVIGLATGLYLVAASAVKRQMPFLLLSAVLFAVWMVPYYKLMDMSVSILLIGALAFLISNPNGRRYFIAGLAVGLAAVFGRNHGLYGLVGSLGVLVWLNIRRVDGQGQFKNLLLWAGGVIAGYLPILLMLLLVPGFAEAFWASIRYLFEFKATNIPLPVPWPWRVDFTALPFTEVLRGVLVGLYFVSLVAFGVLTLAWVFWAKLHGRGVPPALVAAACMALPYAHYAYARADLEHLALGIFPLLVGCVILLAAQPAVVKWSLMLLLCFSSLFVMIPRHPGWQLRAGEPSVSLEISGSKLAVSPGTARSIGLLYSLVDAYAPNGRNFLVTPYWPAAYSLMGRKSGLWEIYAILPRSEQFQQSEIKKIKATDPGFILIMDWPLDGREDLRFSRTHSFIYRYVAENYRKLYSPVEYYELYIPR